MHVVTAPIRICTFMCVRASVCVYINILVQQGGNTLGWVPDGEGHITGVIQFL